MKSRIKIIVMIMTVIGLCGCNGADKHNEQEEEKDGHKTEGVVVLNQKQIRALKLKLGKVSTRNLVSNIRVNGQLVTPPASSAEVTAYIGGNVKSIKVFQGDLVRKGQVLAELEHPDYIALQEEFAQVANNLEFLEKEYLRQKELYENNIGSGREFQLAKSKRNAAKAKYEGLKARLRLLNISVDDVLKGEIKSAIKIKSPIDGYVNKVRIKIGEYVDKNDKLFEISNNNALHADIIVYEKDLHLLRIGQTLHFKVANMPDKEYEAVVFAIGKEFATDTRAIDVHAKIRDNTKGLIPGMYVTGHIHVDSVYTDALPTEAIVSEGMKSYVFIKDDDALKEYLEHESEHSEEEEEHGENGELWAFRLVEVIKGRTDDGFTEVHFVEDLPENAQIVISSAYYLLADMKKEETEH